MVKKGSETRVRSEMRCAHEFSLRSVKRLRREMRCAHDLNCASCPKDTSCAVRRYSCRKAIHAL